MGGGHEEDAEEGGHGPRIPDRRARGSTTCRRTGATGGATAPRTGAGGPRRGPVGGAAAGPPTERPGAATRRKGRVPAAGRQAPRAGDCRGGGRR
ncbi:MAG: hypothetical protein ACK559_23100, partial [bacterium]